MALAPVLCSQWKLSQNHNNVSEEEQGLWVAKLPKWQYLDFLGELTGGRKSIGWVKCLEEEFPILCTDRHTDWALGLKNMAEMARSTCF